MAACDEVVGEYLKALRDGFAVEAVEDGCVVVTPFMRPDNEAVEFSVRELPDGTVEISDNAETLDYLFVNGLNIGSRRLRERLNLIAHRFSIAVTDGELTAIADRENLEERIQALLNAVRDATDLVYFRGRGGPSTFDERVEKLLIEHDVRYRQGAVIRGKEDVHTFKFFVNERHNLPIQPLSTRRPVMAKQKAELLAYHVLDIKLATSQYSFVALLDDSSSGMTRGAWSASEISAPLRHVDHVLYWSERDQIPALVAAK